MARQDEIVRERFKKIDELKRQGIDPYPHKSDVINRDFDMQKKIQGLRDSVKSKNLSFS